MQHMKSISYLFSLVILTLFISSCGPTLRPFTKSMYDDFGWTERDLQNVQFYLSHTIVLKRNAIGNASSIKDKIGNLNKGLFFVIIENSVFYPLDGDHYFFLTHKDFIAKAITEHCKEMTK